MLKVVVVMFWCALFFVSHEGEVRADMHRNRDPNQHNCAMDNQDSQLAPVRCGHYVLVLPASHPLLLTCSSHIESHRSHHHIAPESLNQMPRTGADASNDQQTRRQTRPPDKGLAAGYQDQDRPHRLFPRAYCPNCVR
ncbi:hypothetical protein B0T24DRAFT_384272 [Lasiosphaeria ovina]|uniref:Secreted protein n=1 Tax=Lasiosphaeria ovina TaxID=92902 RepID=A0AAE0JZB5_9PEZI|nr:hypothetical protein B0T24DRAFT_384272 [Lasiosphaeria ovina]